MKPVKLAKPKIWCENASGQRRQINLRSLQLLREAGRVAKMIQRRKDGAVTRVMLLAEPNEIAHGVTAQATVIEVGRTWWHRPCLGLLGQKQA